MDKLILGCGYLGRRVAALWRAQGHAVAALTRRPSHLAFPGITAIPGDVCDPATLTVLPEVGTVLYAIGLDRAAGRSMREVYVTGLANALTALPRNTRLIYVSSTSAYGQTDGDWVDETSPTEPLEESGRIVLEAEETLLKMRPDAVRLRFAGIYGPKRLLREKAIVNGDPLGGDPAKWLNLIHVEDGARAVLAVEQHAAPGDLVLVADDEPVTRRDYYTHLATLLGAPAARFDNTPASRETHRRISNAKLKTLGFVANYPNYRSGLAASIPASYGPGS